MLSTVGGLVDILFNVNKCKDILVVVKFQCPELQVPDVRGYLALAGGGGNVACVQRSYATERKALAH